MSFTGAPPPRAAWPACVETQRITMSRRSPALPIILALLAATGADARGRTDTRALTCASLKALVAREGDVVLASSEYVYETVHRDAGACQIEETGLPAFEPTSDERSCFVGWRCAQRANDPNQK